MNLFHCCFNTWTNRHSSQQQQSQQQEQHGAAATRRPTASVGVGMWTTINCFEMVVNSTVAVREGTSMSLKCRTTCKHGAIVPTAAKLSCQHIPALGKNPTHDLAPYIVQQVFEKVTPFAALTQASAQCKQLSIVIVTHSVSVVRRKGEEGAGGDSLL